MHRFIVLLFLTFVLSNCTEYSPNQVFDNNSPKDINQKNIQKILATPDNDTLTIAFIGDSQRFYDEVELFVDKVNEFKDVDFVIIAGDISDFGLLAEFEWITTRLDKLNVPYIGVIGNHDVIANGEQVFERMFGPLNYSFVYDSVKFIVHNTNSREYLGQNVPDLNWLSTELAPSPSVKHFIAVSHVPPFNGDFNKDLEVPYSQQFRDTPGFLLSLHGHIHNHTDGYPYEDGIRYITSHFFPQRKFVKLEVHHGQVTKTLIDY
jgi:3',5'-cyclic-AMP phosphodiesterase